MDGHDEPAACISAFTFNSLEEDLAFPTLALSVPKAMVSHPQKPANLQEFALWIFMLLSRL